MPANMEKVPDLLVKVEKLSIHKCVRCPEVFTNSSELIKHLLCHNEWLLKHAKSAYVSVQRAKIDLKCFDCNKCFESRKDLTFHTLVHLETKVEKGSNIKKNNTSQDKISKPYRCPDCDVTFVAQSTLEAHSILHKPFPHICKCGIGYYEKTDLKAHIQLVHRKRVLTECGNLIH